MTHVGVNASCIKYDKTAVIIITSGLYFNLCYDGQIKSFGGHFNWPNLPNLVPL